MNMHQNARLAPHRRALMVRRVPEEGWPANVVAADFGNQRADGA